MSHFTYNHVSALFCFFAFVLFLNLLYCVVLLGSAFCLVVFCNALYFTLLF